MSKQSGLGDNFYVGGYDISGDVTSLNQISGGNTPLTGMTGIDKSAMERLGGVRNGVMNVTSWFNPSNNQAHDRLSILPTADTIGTFCRGTSLGSPAASINAKQVNYDGTRGTDGSLPFVSQLASNSYGLEWGRQLTAGKRTDTTATNGSSVDLGSASPGAFGLQMYVQIFAFTGTSVTIKIQESSDNGGGDAFADVAGATTGAQTGITALRVATGLINVERYLRVVTTGTFSNAVFNVMATRNDTSVVF